MVFYSNCSTPQSKGMIKKVYLIITFFLLSSYISNIYAQKFPHYKFYTDKENEFLLGNVKSVILKTDEGTKCEFNFNRQGNYTSVSILEGYPRPEYPFCNKFYRYYCEGTVVNNYYNNFLSNGIRHDDYHVPFWFYLMGASKNLSFRYDNNGNLVSVTRKTIGAPDEYKFVYDSNGNLTTRYCNDMPMMKIQWSGHNITSFCTYRSEGELVEGHDFKITGNRIELSTKGRSYEKIYIVTDNNGKIISYEKVQGSGWDAIKNKMTCAYNERGLIEKLTTTYSNKENKYTLVTTIKYDEYCNILEYKSTKNSVTEQFFKYSYSYDKIGNWISRVTYSVKQGDIEVKQKIATDTRQITYYDGEKVTNPSGDEQGKVDKMPEFPGGPEALFSFLNENINEDIIEKAGGKGRVVATFMVESDGSITDIKVVKSVDPVIDSEFMRVLQLMPRWIPGKQNGAPVRVKYSVPLTIR